MSVVTDAIRRVEADLSSLRNTVAKEQGDSSRLRLDLDKANDAITDLRERIKNAFDKRIADENDSVTCQHINWGRKWHQVNSTQIPVMDMDSVFSATTLDEVLSEMSGRISGTQDYLPKFTAAGNAVVDSPFYDSSGDLKGFADGKVIYLGTDDDGTLGTSGSTILLTALTTGYRVDITTLDSNIRMVPGSRIVQMYSADAGAAGPVLDGYHDSASPAASDVVFDIQGNGEDTNGDKLRYGGITFTIADPTYPSTQDGLTKIGVLVSGTYRDLIKLGGNTQPEIVFNDDQLDVDFRIESDINEYAFWMDASKRGNICLNTSDLETWSAFYGCFQMPYDAIGYRTASPELTFFGNCYYGTDWQFRSAGSAAMINVLGNTPAVRLWVSNATGALDGTITWTESLTAGRATVDLGVPLKIKESAAAAADTAAYGQFWVKDDAPCTPWFTDDTGAGYQLAWAGSISGTTNTIAKFTSAGAVGDSSITDDGSTIKLNPSQADVDTQISSTGATHLFYADAANDRIGIGESTPQCILHVYAASAPQIRISNVAIASGINACMIGVCTGANQFLSGTSSGDTAIAAKAGGTFWLGAGDTATSQVRSIGIDFNAISLLHTTTLADGASLNLQEDITFGGATGENRINLPDNLANALNIRNVSTSMLTFVTTDNSEEVVVNEGGVADMSFRVETSGQTHSLYIDGSTGNMAMGTSSTSNWGANTGSIEFPESSITYNRTAPTLALLGNVYYDAGWKFKTADDAAYLNIAGNIPGFIYYVSSVSGAADDTITWYNIMDVRRSSIVFNQSGRDVDTRFESDTRTYALFLQGSDGFIGINDNSPGYDIDLAGDLCIQDDKFAYFGTDADAWIEWSTGEPQLNIGTTSAGAINISTINGDIVLDPSTGSDSVIIYTKLDLASQSAEFHPTRTAQSAIPTPSVGELRVWRDTDDGKVYLVYNDTDSGVKSVEMT